MKFAHHQYILPETVMGRRDLPDLVGPRYPRVIAELGVGRGRVFSLLSQHYPDTFFVGVDLFYKPLSDTAKKLHRVQADNAWLIRANVVQPALIFPDGFLDGIVVNFPDPWPKKKHARHRLFYGPAAKHLKKILKPGGWVFLQTDQLFYFQDAMALLREAGFEVTEGAVPPLWNETFKSGFQMLFEGKGEPFSRLIATRN